MLLDLPNELLLRVLAGAGNSGLCAAAVTCRRLAVLKAALEDRTHFSSALEAGALADAVAAATRRAREGMLGAADFAVVLLWGFGEASRGRGAETDAAVAEQRLLATLGRDVPVFGGWTEGVMGLDAAGALVERDGRPPPGSGAVVVVLGRMPGVCPVAFAGRVPPKPRGVHSKMPLPLSAMPWPPLQDALQAGAAAFAQQQVDGLERAARRAAWGQPAAYSANQQPGACSAAQRAGGANGSSARATVGPGSSSLVAQGGVELVPELLLLLVAPSEAAIEVVDLALEWVGERLGPCPVAGGICGGCQRAGGLLLCHPSPGGSVAKPQAKEPQHMYTGLALCVPRQEAGTSNGGGSAAAAPAGTVDCDGDSAATACDNGGCEGSDCEGEGAADAAAGGCSPPGGDELGTLLLAAAALPADAVPSRTAAPSRPAQQQPRQQRRETVLASALAVQGLRAAPRAAVWEVGDQDIWLSEGLEDVGPLLTIKGVSKALPAAEQAPQRRSRTSQRQQRQSDASTAAHGEAAMVELSCGLEASGALAVWRGGQRPERHAASDDPSQELVLVRHEGNFITTSEAGYSSSVVMQLDVGWMGAGEVEALRALLAGDSSAGSSGRLYMQPTQISAEASEALISRELPRTLSRLAPATDTDGCCAAATAAAAASGIAAGSRLLLDFSCSGRGRHLYGRTGVEPRLAAEACSSPSTVVAGCFLNGEIGPAVRGGAAGWRGGRSDGIVGDGGGGGCQGVRRSNTASETQRQAFTSVFACVGAA